MVQSSEGVVMSQKDFQPWSTEKAQELFALSHKLMDVAKQLSEHHAAELQTNMTQALEFAKLTAKNDLNKLKEFQEKAAQEAVERMEGYQKKVKGLLKQMGKDTADEAEKHYDKAKTALEDWLDDAGKKIPIGGVEFSKMVKEVSEASNKVYKEGRRTIDHALEAADKQLEEITEKTKVAAKKATVAKTTSTAAKKTATTTKKTT
jgi:hypothetical protein